MRRPFGDKDGFEPELSVRRTTTEPLAFIVYIELNPSLSDVNAMRRPFGDQDGSLSSCERDPLADGSRAMESLVSRVTPEPSAFIAYISQFPSR